MSLLQKIRWLLGNSVPLATRSDSLVTALIELLQQHKVQAEAAGEWIVLSGRSARFSIGIAREGHPRPHTFTVELIVRFEADSTQTVVESFIGVGKSRPLALVDAFTGFVSNTFHVLLRAFLTSEENQVAVERWPVRDKSREVVVGAIAMRGSFRDPSRTPDDWLATFRSALETADLTPGRLWVRIYYAWMEGQAPTLEVMLDNGNWLAMREALAEFDWPAGSPFVSIRLNMAIGVEET